jgi:2-oxo-4-hydroxy-4-carboxy-5-ureidoimidazoline decarboxylase
MSKTDLATLATLSQEAFVSLLPIYEHSPWVPLGAFTKASPFESITGLHACLKSVVDEASDERKLELIRAHPDLAGKAALAGELTEASKTEQSNAGLDSLTPSEMEDFQKMNAEYKAKFGFPFILAVRNATKHTILGAFEARLSNSKSREFEQALTQIHKIAWMRLLSIIEPMPTGFLTCHILDTASGKPASSMRLSLERLTGEGPIGVIGNYVTNSDGRLPSGPALKGKDFTTGTYQWLFQVGDYFTKECATSTSAQPFLNVVPIVFGIDNPEDHYHVPLLVSPFSFSTYRGS